MAFELEDLTGLGISADKAERIKALHDETISKIQADIEAVKQEAEEYKAKAEEAKSLAEEIESIGTDVQTQKEWKAKYEAEKAALDAFRSEQEAKAEIDRKKQAYKALLLEAGVRPRYTDSILRVCDVSSFRLDEGGKLENPEAIKADISNEWADFIPARIGRKNGD